MVTCLLLTLHCVYFCTFCYSFFFLCKATFSPTDIYIHEARDTRARNQHLKSATEILLQFLACLSWYRFRLVPNSGVSWNHFTPETGVQCCCQGLETQGRGRGLDVQGRGQGQGLENWSSRTRTFLEDNNTGHARD